jgi:hypothetical protein
MATEKATADPPVTQNVLLDALKLLIDQQGPRASAINDDTLTRLIAKLDGRDQSGHNPEYPRHSSLNFPEGERARPKPRLLRETWHNSARIREDECTPAEVLAFNALSESLPQPGDERSSRDGRWIAKVSRNNAKLIVLIPCKTVEDRAEANNTSVLMFCRELAEGKGAITPESMAADLAQLKADRDRMEALLRANGIVLPAAAPA